MRIQDSYYNAFLLPLANEVWGKVIVLHLSVSHSVQGCGVHPRQTLPALPEMATEAGSTHPTGMHSCFRINFLTNYCDFKGTYKYSLYLFDACLV